MPPVAFDAQALKFLALHLDPVLREVAALFAEFVDLDLILVLSLGAVLLLDLPFDRQAVTIPARNVVRVVAKHLVRARNQIFQNFIECMADMDVAVRIRRAVVENEFLAALRGLAHQLVEIDLLPARENLRLLLGQAGAHRKIGLGQEQRLRIIGAVLLLFGHRGRGL